MKIEYFDYLIVVEKYHSISEAARHLYLGQTTLSAMIKSVENELGFSIFQRTPTGVIATKKGEELLQFAREITLKYEAVTKIKDGLNAETYPFTMLSARGLATNLMLGLNRTFRQNQANCAINFYERPRLEIISEMIYHKGNVGLTYIFDDEIERIYPNCAKYNIIIEPLFEDKFYLLVSERHKFGNKQLIHLNEILGEYHACSADLFDTATDRKTPAAFSSLGYYASRKRTILPSIDLVKQAVLSENMVCILPGSIASPICDQSLRMIPLDGDDVPSLIHICLVHNKEKRRVEKLAVQYIREYFQAMSEE